MVKNPPVNAGAVGEPRLIPGSGTFPRGGKWLPTSVFLPGNDPDNHDDVITNLEPDILECEVKWALGSITTNKASGGDGIPVELYFKS